MNTEQLDHLKEQLLTQDNLGTSHPLCVVYQKRPIWQVHGDGIASPHVWRMVDDPEVEADEKESAILDQKAGNREETEIDGDAYWMEHYLDVDVFCAACLTREGAERYLRNNGHNLRKPFIFVESSWRNQEMIEIRNHFMGGEHPKD